MNAGTAVISPSVLSADFARLGEDIKKASDAGADRLHIDVMDGVFVPNITIGIPVVAAIREITGLPLDVHLMIDRPGRYVDAFLSAGADYLTLHVEADEPQDLIPALNKIRGAGKKSGLSLKPKTPASVIFPYLELCDLILVMTVEPGFGGQEFMPDQLPKIQALRGEVQKRGLSVDIAVDGGINAETGKLVKNAGANVLAAGSYIFGADDMRSAIASLR